MIFCCELGKIKSVFNAQITLSEPCVVRRSEYVMEQHEAKLIFL